MDKNYISTVLNKIKNNTVKAAVQSELEDHYSERVEYYTNIGYDKETAESKANEVFGDDAEIVGEQMDQLNGNHKFRYAVFAVINVLLIIISLWSFIKTDSFPASAPGELISVVFIILSLSGLISALKNKSAFLSGLCTANCVLFGILFWNSGLMYYFFYVLIDGNAESLLELINVVIFILRTAFWIASVILSVFSTVLCVKFKKCSYKKQNIRQEKIVKLLLSILLSVILIMIVFLLLYLVRNIYYFW